MGSREGGVKGRILIFDEDTAFRAALAERLELLDLVVDHAFDYHGAISQLIRNDYDLVLCDSKRALGRMHGGHIARWVREMRLGTPVHLMEKPVHFSELTELLLRH